jgi:curli biogenesis system outer membrane secretion channel CsgG
MPGLARLKLILFAIIFPFCLGCVDLVPIEVTMPGEIDMTGLRRIAVVPFAPPAKDNGNPTVESSIKYAADLALGHSRSSQKEQEAVARDVTDHVTGLLSDTGFFTVVDSEAVMAELAKEDNAAVSPQQLGQTLGVDALITGNVTRMNIMVQEQSIEKPNGMSDSTVFLKRAEIQVTYRVLDVKTNQLVVQRSFNGDDAFIGYGGSPVLPSDLEMFQKLSARILSPIPHQLAPYVVVENRPLLTDNTDPEMKSLKQLVDKKMYPEALEGYQKIWQSTGNRVAGYNAAILKEKLGDIDGAISVMREVAAATRDGRAAAELQRMMNAKGEMEAAAAEM